MIHYEDYLDICPKINTSVQPTNFIRSQFDYGVRQRKIVGGYVTYPFTLLLQGSGAHNFTRMWADLNDGTDSFYYNNPIHYDFTHNKEIRFTQSYTLTELGNYDYMLSCSIELITTGDKCPNVVYPTNILTPVEKIC